MATTILNSTGITFPDGISLTTANDTASIASSGWQRMPDGFIVQWGQFQTGGVNGSFASGSATFARVFPNACLCVFASGGPSFQSVSTSTTGISCTYDFLGYTAFVQTTRYIVFGY